MKESIERMQFLANSMPKTIKESLEYEPDASVDEEFEDEAPVEEPAAEVEKTIEAPEEKPCNVPNDAATLVNDIRKKALRAMADLADCPEDPNYELLKKIWQLCDRTNEKKAPVEKEL